MAKRGSFEISRGVRSTLPGQKVENCYLGGVTEVFSRLYARRLQRLCFFKAHEEQSDFQ